MQKPITAQLPRKRIPSLDALARTLIKRYPDDFGEVPFRVLSVRLGALNNGNPVWWDKRPQKLDRLLEFLGLDRNELAAAGDSNRHTFQFEVFPSVPALDLRHEEIWEIGELVQMDGGRRVAADRYRAAPSLRYWQDGVGLTPTKPQWLHVSDATEYSLLSRKLAASGRYDAIFITSLKDASDQDKKRLGDPAPLVVVIRDVMSRHGLASLIAESPKAARLIVSPFALPVRSDDYDDATVPADQAAANSIESLAWVLKRQWRHTLLQWLDQRLKHKRTDTLFSADVARALLDKFDPDGQWFVSVRDVLVLCRALDDAKEHKLQHALGGRDDVSRLLELLLGENESQVRLIEQLVSTRWNRWDLPWAGELAVDDWRDLAEGLCDVDALQQKSIIVPDASGYDFADPIVTRLLLRSYLLKVLNNGDTASWAGACFDAQRRPLLDAALDTVPMGVLEALADQAMHDTDPADAVGAVEALFVAAGRRLIRSEAVGKDLLALAPYTLGRLSCQDGSAIPLTRPLNTPEAAIEWTSICLAWSLSTAPVKGWTESWSFAGWHATLPETMDGWPLAPRRYGPSGPALDWTDLTAPMRGLLSVVTRWLARQNEPLPYDSLPQVFRIGLLVHAAADKWPAQPSWWYGVLGEPAVEQALMDMLGALHTVLTDSAAQAWWPSLIGHMASNSNRGTFQWLGRFTDAAEDDAGVNIRSSILAAVMQRLENDAEAQLRRLNDESRSFLITNPGSLSPPFRRALLRIVSQDPDSNLSRFANPLFLSRFGSAAAPELKPLLGHKMLGDTAAWLFWKYRPTEARRLMRTHDKLEPSAVRNLLMRSPIDAAEIAMTVALERPSVLSVVDRRAWVHARLPDARQHARTVLRMLDIDNQRSIHSGDGLL